MKNRNAAASSSAAFSFCLLDDRAVHRFLLGGPQAVALRSVQGGFGSLAHGGNFRLVARHEAGLVLVEFLAGGVIAFAHDLLFLLFWGRFLDALFDLGDALFHFGDGLLRLSRPNQRADPKKRRDDIAS